MNFSGQPNLFLVLDIDPDKPWSQADFERKLQEKRHEWARLAIFPNEQGLKAKANLNLVSKLREFAQDEGQRKLQAEEALKAAVDGQKVRLQEFQKRLKLLEVKGYLLEAELTQLIKDFPDILTEEEIRKKIKVPIQNPPNSDGTSNQSLEPSLAKDIHRKLEQLGKRTLYDFLNLSETVENRLLVQRAKEHWTKVQNKGTKTAEDTLISDLCGHCFKLFSSDAQRVRYDETLRLQAFESIKNNADTMAAVSKKLESTQVEALLKQARAQGLDIDEAAAILEAHALSRRYILVVPADNALVKNLLLCGVCGHLNQADKTYCTQCSQPLKLPCPQCKQMLTSEDRACGNCGFAIGNSGLVDHLLLEAKEAVRQQKLDDALDQLSQAQGAWPAPEQDGRTQQIKQLRHKVQQIQDQHRKIVQQVKDLIEQRKFVAARTLIPQLRQVLPTEHPQRSQLEREVEQSLSKADALYNRLNAVDRKNEMALVRSYREVLAICIDYQEGKLAQQTDNLEKKLQQEEQRRIRLLTEIRDHCRDRQYYTAKKLLFTLRRQGADDELHILEQEITQKIAEAQQHVSRAQAAVDRDEETVVRSCMQALRICSDADQAQSLLAQMPPSPPQMLRAVARGDVVHLSWAESPSPMVNYLVLRKADVRPSTSIDGDRLATVADAQYDDKTAEVGVSSFYAVYAVRQGVTSERAATHTTAVMRVAPVRNITKLIDDGRITLQWEPPANVDQIVVRRSDQTFPHSPIEGHAISVINNQQATDSQLIKDQTYYYSIFSIFGDYEGRQRVADPVQIEATVQTPPPPITDLSLSTLDGNEQQVRLRWTQPGRGDVVLLHTQKQIDLHSGQSLPRSELEKYGRVLMPRSNYATFALKEMGAHIFYPVVIMQDVAYVGQPQEHFTLPDVKNLWIEDLNHTLRIRWDWPPNCQEAHLSYAYADWPDRDSDPILINVSRREYDQSGYYELTSPRRLNHHFWVRSVWRQDGQYRLSTGSNPDCRTMLERRTPMVLEYAVERKHRIFAPLHLTLQIELRKGAGSLPALILVGKEGEPPASREDGVPLLPVDAQFLGEKLRLTFNVTEHGKRNFYVRLFLTDDNLYDMVQIRHPDSSLLRLY